MQDIILESEHRQDPAQIDHLLYEQRGDWTSTDFYGRDRDQVLRWIFDRINDTEQTRFCWWVKINGRRGYLFCEYDHNGTGIDGICLYHKRGRKAFYTNREIGYSN